MVFWFAHIDLLTIEGLIERKTLLLHFKIRNRLPSPTSPWSLASQCKSNVLSNGVWWTDWLKLFLGWSVIELCCFCGKLWQRVLAEGIDFGWNKVFKNMTYIAIKAEEPIINSSIDSDAAMPFIIIIQMSTSLAWTNHCSRWLKSGQSTRYSSFVFPPCSFIFAE